MSLLTWIFRFLVVLFVVRLLLRLLSAHGARRRGQAGSPDPGRTAGWPGGRRDTGERAGGPLVRDPQCGTYVAEASAIRMTRGGETVFFCSETCRATYAAAHPV